MSIKFLKKNFSYSNIKTCINKNTLLIELNRPKQLNALNCSLFQELNNALKEADKDKNIRSIILTGNDKAFAAGADIKEMQNKQFSEVYSENFLENWNYLMGIKKPIIAAVSGFALGGGFELAMMCDILVCSKTAKFGLPELKLGTIPGAGGTQRLIREVGKAKAMEMILTSDFLDAEEAYKLGLVSKISENVIEDALKIAEKINEKSTLIVQMAKESINKAYELPLKDGLDFEKKVFWSTFATKDRKIGMDAFVNKEKPQFVDE